MFDMLLLHDQDGAKRRSGSSETTVPVSRCLVSFFWGVDARTRGSEEATGLGSIFSRKRGVTQEVRWHGVHHLD